MRVPRVLLRPGGLATVVTVAVVVVLTRHDVAIGLLGALASSPA